MSDENDWVKRRAEEERIYAAEQSRLRDEADTRARAQANEEAERYHNDRGRAYSAALAGQPADYSSQGAIDGTAAGRQAREAAERERAHFKSPSTASASVFRETSSYAPGASQGGGAGCAALFVAVTALFALVGIAGVALEATSKALRQLSHGEFIVCLWGGYALLGTVIAALGMHFAQDLSEEWPTRWYHAWPVTSAGMAACACITWLMEALTGSLRAVARSLTTPGYAFPVDAVAVVQLPGLLVLIAVLTFGLGKNHRSLPGAFRSSVVACAAASASLTVVVLLGLWRARSGT